MKKFEYIELYAGGFQEYIYEEDKNYKPRLMEELNELGKQGWELVSFYNTTEDKYPYAVLKREI